MLDKLTKRIQELVPEIMTLGLGCKVKVQIDEDEINIDYVHKLNDVGDIGVYVEGEGHTVSVFEDCDFIEILGRDITLEDVLVALKDKVTNTQEYELERGLAIFFVETEPLESEPFKWHLNKPLHEQEKECIEKLYQILK